MAREELKAEIYTENGKKNTFHAINKLCAFQNSSNKSSVYIYSFLATERVPLHVEYLRVRSINTQ